jgi:hypothetical protein
MAENRLRSCGMSESLLARYVDSELSESEEIWVEKHLAKCSDCAEQTQRMRTYRHSWAVLSPDFPASVQRLTARAIASRETDLQDKRVPAVGAAPEQIVLEQALAAEAQEASPELRPRFLEWAQRLGQVARQTVADMLGSTESALTLSSAELSRVLAASGWFWSAEFSLATLGTRTRGAQRRAPSSRLSRHGGLSMSWRWVEEKDIEVSISGLPPTARMPFVLLVPLRRDLRFRRRAQLQPDPKKKDRWVARFDDVKAGSYTIALQPLNLSKSA